MASKRSENIAETGLGGRWAKKYKNVVCQPKHDLATRETAEAGLGLSHKHGEVVLDRRPTTEAQRLSFLKARHRAVARSGLALDHLAACSRALTSRTVLSGQLKSSTVEGGWLLIVKETSVWN